METDTLEGIENLLSGGGNDALKGNGGANMLSSGLGNDSVICANGNDSLFGGGGDDSLNGGMGDDLVDGGSGIDTAIFAIGSTAAIVNLALTVGQVTGYGTDTLFGIENVVSGGGNDSLTGNTLANALFSSSGDDRVRGGGGNDTIDSGIGDDTVTGGLGADDFMFSAIFNIGDIDHITDFDATVDAIWLQNDTFLGLVQGNLATSAFRSNTTGLAGDASDRIIYDSSTGGLFFDRDGSGGVAGVRFATVAAGLTITGADFTVF